MRFAMSPRRPSQCPLRVCACALGAAVILSACVVETPTTAVPSAPGGSHATQSVSPPVETWWPTSRADERAAEAVLSDYMEAIARGDFAAAWSLLGPGSQAAFGSQEAFAADSAAFMESAQDEYVLGAPRHDEALFDQWVPRPDPASPARARAYVSRVRYPHIQTPAGFEILVAAPDANGGWRVWKVR